VTRGTCKDNDRGCDSVLQPIIGPGKRPIAVVRLSVCLFRMMDIKAREASEAVIVQGKLQSAHYLTSPRFRRGTFFVCTLTRRQSGDREEFTIIDK